MGDEIFIGAVRFNSDDIDAGKTQRSVASNGKTLWSVFLKNGTKIKFYDQKPGANASVTVGYDQGNENKYGTAFNGIRGLIIEGSEKDDYYHLMNCDYYEVDTKDGGKDEVRAVNTNGEPKSKAFNVGAEDNAYQVDVSHGISRSEGFFIRTKPDDEVHNDHDDKDYYGYKLAQPLARDIPEANQRQIAFYNQFVDSSIFRTPLGFKFRRTEEADGSVTLVGADMFDMPLKVNIKHNDDGTTMLKCTESTRTEPNKVFIVDTKSKALLYDRYTDGEQSFFNADGSTSVYDKDGKFLRTLPPYKAPEE